MPLKLPTPPTPEIIHTKADFDAVVEARGLRGEVYLSDDQATLAARGMGYTDAQLPAAAAMLREQLYELLQNAEIYGRKPTRSSGEKTHLLDIPESPLRIRIWGEGRADAERAKQFFIDFVDASGDPVNSPSEYTLRGHSRPGMPAPIGRLRSINEAMGLPRERIPPGEEMFGVPEGAHVVLKRKDKPDVLFHVPARVPGLDHALVY